ncbi:MAG: hypothetical protein HOV73_22510, partial [Streptomyces sp.]|nr:hypothetical protein [Streptomyces sp.]
MSAPDDPYVVLAAAAARWDRVSGRLGTAERERLTGLVAVVRDRTRDERLRYAAARQAADLLAGWLPDEFGADTGARFTGTPGTPHTGARFTGTPGTPQISGRPTVQGFDAEDLAVLLIDGHRMVGPVLGPVRERLLAEPALDAETLLRRGGAPFAPELIRLPGIGGRLRLPRFQFSEDTLPWLVVLEVNAFLAADRDPWGAADWWLSANAWLGTTPVSLLGTEHDRQLPD